MNVWKSLKLLLKVLKADDDNNDNDDAVNDSEARDDYDNET